MNLTPEDRSELDDLLDDLAAGVFDDAQRSRLNALLHSNPAAQRIYLDYFGVHAALAHEALARPTTVDIRLAMQSLAADRSTSEEPSQTNQPVPAERPKSPVLGFLGNVLQVTASSPKVVVSLVMAGFCCYFGILLWNVWAGRPHHEAATSGQAVAGEQAPGGRRSLPNGQPVATVSGDANVRWSARSVTVRDRRLISPNEILEIDSGLVRLQLSRGATLLVEGPARWSIDGDNRASLLRGKIVAHVPSQAVGFELGTPQAKVTDLGTDFGVSVDASGTTETQVFRGAVEVVPAAAPTAGSRQPVAKQRLTTGQGARVSASAPAKVQMFATQQATFVRELPAGSDSGAGNSAPLTSDYAELVIERTKPVLYWSFDNVRGRNCADLVRSLAMTNFVAERSDVPGPRPADGFLGLAASNRGLEVAGDGGVVCSEAAQLGLNSQHYSLQVWFNSSVEFSAQRLHYLLSRGNGLQAIVDVRDSVLISGSFQAAGTPGRLCFYDGNLDNSGFVAGTTALRPHQWYQVTLVRDGDHVQVYLDGTLEVESDKPWLGGEGDCVSAGHRTDLYATLGLCGSFDELAVWNRALSEQEISSLARAARQKSSDATSQQK